MRIYLLVEKYELHTLATIPNGYLLRHQDGSDTDGRALLGGLF